MAASKLSDLNIATYYDVVIPQTMERAKFRPMRVKEERALLTADASENGSVMINTLHNVVKSCVEMIETKYLTSFDLEYLFTQIRAKSVGEITTLYLLCDTPGCEDVEVRYEYHLSDIKVVFPEGVSDIIKLSDDLAIKMRYPSVDEAIDIELQEEADKNYKAVCASVELIYTKDEVIDVREEDKQSVIDFIDRLTSSQYEKLEQFLDDQPTVEGKVEYKCPRCGKQHTIELKGISSFF